MVQELVIEGFDLLLVKLVDLVGLNLHLLEVEKLLSLLALGLKVTVLILTILVHLMRQVRLEGIQLSHHLFLLSGIDMIINLLAESFLLFFKFTCFVALVNLVVDFAFSTVELLLFLHLQLSLMDFDVILLNLSQLIIKSIELVVD